MNIRLAKIKNQCTIIKEKNGQKKEIAQTARLMELGSVLKVKEGHRWFLELLMSPTNCKEGGSGKGRRR